MTNLHSHIYDPALLHSEIQMTIIIQNNIKIDHKETGCESVKRIILQGDKPNNGLL
jgi:hypothetical protein